MKAYTLTATRPPGSMFKSDKQPKRAPKRAMAPDHLAFIRLLPCLISGARPAEAAHIRMGSPLWGKESAGIGKTADDRWAVPLSHQVHMQQHSMGEAMFWQRHGLDPFVIASRLYEVSGDQDKALGVIADARRVMK